MKSKHTSNAAATELSDDALLGVFGGYDGNSGDSGENTLASADSLYGPEGDEPSSAPPPTVPTTTAAAPTTPITSAATPTAAAPTAAAPTTPSTAVEGDDPADVPGEGEGEGEGEGAPTTPVVAATPSAASTGTTAAAGMPPVGTTPGAPSAAVTPGVAASTAVVPGTGIPGGPSTGTTRPPVEETEHDHHDYVERFEEALDQAHDGYHQIVDGIKDIAHAAIDMIPEHGPVGIGLHILDKIRDRHNSQS